MKKISLFILCMFVTVGSIFAANSGGTISATDTEADTAIQAKNLFIRNDGANEVFIELKRRGDDADVDATTSSFELPVNGEVTARSERGFTGISTICSSTETASVEYLAWD